MAKQTSSARPHIPTRTASRVPKVAGTVTRKLPLPKPRPQKPMPKRTGK